MYDEFEAVLLKDGRFASIDDKPGPGVYIATVGSGPKNWEVIDITEADIERRLTEEEIKRWAKETRQQLSEMGL